MVRQFFSVPDPEINQESSVDPMGVQVIWTAYGQAVFSEKLTTIANDLRVFTFNLFHNYLIHSLYKEYPEQLAKAKVQYKGWRTDTDITTGLLMFLEDMVTWIFFLEDNEGAGNIDRLGILGLLKARSLYHSKDLDSILLTAHKRSGLLKNQINLGMSGRYKGPFINMEFFDRSFTYLPRTWDLVEELINDWKPARELQSLLSRFIVQVVLSSSRKEAPQMSLADLKAHRSWKLISQGYLACFGHRKLPKDVRNYWRDKLGLCSGAAKAVYDQIARWEGADYLNHETIFEKAKQGLHGEPEEQKKIQNILTVEPLLSHAEYLLRLLSQQTCKTLADEEGELSVLRSEARRAGNFDMPGMPLRLKELQKVMLSEGSLREWINRVLLYHKKIMEQRGGTPWLELDEKGVIKHYFCSSLPEEINRVKTYLESNWWLHTYYLETVRSIHLGLENGRRN